MPHTMWVFVRRYTVLALVLLGLSVSSAEAQRFKWWHSDRFQQELALSAEQTERLEEIYRAAVPTLKGQKATLDAIRGELSKMVADGLADEGLAADLIGRVEKARGDLGGSRALMLYRMRRILTSDQHLKLKVLFDERERQRQRRRPTGVRK